MLFLIFVGALSLVFGLLFLFNPDALRRINEIFSQQLSFEDKVLRARIGVGISLLLTSVLVFFVAYYIYVKYMR